MKFNLKLSAIILVLLIALLAAPVSYLRREPVLFVSEMSFIMLYGQDRVLRETRRASLSLFRRVKPVIVAGDASDDIIRYAIADVSSRPYAVIFPLRLANAARIYREQNPEIPVIILEGRRGSGESPASFAIRGSYDDFFLFNTNIEADFYRAGLAAAIIDGEQNGRIAVFLEPAIQIQATEAFLQALGDTGSSAVPQFLTSFAQFSIDPQPTCIIIKGIGYEFFDRYSGVPVIYFSWLPPELMPNDIVIVFNDSLLAQLVQAVRMVSAGVNRGQISSNIQLLERSGLERSVINTLRRIE